MPPALRVQSAIERTQAKIEAPNATDVCRHTLVVVGVLLWLVNNCIPMDGTIKGILNERSPESHESKSPCRKAREARDVGQRAQAHHGLLYGSA